MNDPTRVSKWYPPEEAWPGFPVWWFEFPPGWVPLDVHAFVNLLCENPGDPEDFYLLRIPATLLRACRHHLGFREDREIYSLYVSARPSEMFTEVRGTGAIDFRPCLADCDD
jgi:hypothetical protein